MTAVPVHVILGARVFGLISLDIFFGIGLSITVRTRYWRPRSQSSSPGEFYYPFGVLVTLVACLCAIGILLTMSESRDDSASPRTMRKDGTLFWQAVPDEQGTFRQPIGLTGVHGICLGFRTRAIRFREQPKDRLTTWSRALGVSWTSMRDELKEGGVIRFGTQNGSAKEIPMDEGVRRWILDMKADKVYPRLHNQLDTSVTIDNGYQLMIAEHVKTGNKILLPIWSSAKSVKKHRTSEKTLSKMSIQELEQHCAKTAPQKHYYEEDEAQRAVFLHAEKIPSPGRASKRLADAIINPRAKPKPTKRRQGSQVEYPPAAYQPQVPRQPAHYVQHQAQQHPSQYSTGYGQTHQWDYQYSTGYQQPSYVPASYQYPPAYPGDTYPGMTYQVPQYDVEVPPPQGPSFQYAAQHQEAPQQFPGEGWSSPECVSGMEYSAAPSEEEARASSFKISTPRIFNRCRR